MMKLKAVNEKERHHKWKEHFKCLTGGPPEIMYKPTEEIINYQQDIELGCFMDDELGVILKLIKKFDNIFNYAMVCINNTQ